MSQSVQEVLNAISEASQALNREPEYKANIISLQGSLDEYMKHAQELELHIVNYKNQIGELQAKCRSLEVERDDMGFRELEATDKLDALRMVVKSFTSAIDPHMPKTVEIKQAESVAQSPSTLPQPSALSGQSESPLPSVSNTESPPVNASMLGADNGTSVESSTTKPYISDELWIKPYSGKTYSEVFGSTSNEGVTLDDWVTRGGRREDWWA